MSEFGWVKLGSFGDSFGWGWCPMNRGFVYGIMAYVSYRLRKA